MKSYLTILAVLFCAVCLTSAAETISKEKQTQQQVALTNINTVNINQANKAQLSQLKGIGDKRALAIIAYREKLGQFSSVEQLLEVKGIGQKFLVENKAFLTL